MGYRSRVRCLIYGEPDQINALIVKHKLLGNEALGEDSWFEPKRYMHDRTYYDAAETEAQPMDDNGGRKAIYKTKQVEVIDLELDDVKWYEGYPDVDAWMRMLGEIAADATPDEPCLCYEFIRLGEEDSDTEVAGSVEDGGDYWLAVDRYITTQLSIPEDVAPL